MHGTWQCEPCDHVLEIWYSTRTGPYRRDLCYSKGVSPGLLSLARVVLMGEARNGELALDWESCASIRSRFRRDISWIQWPVLAEETTGGNDAGGDGDNDTIPKRPICTKSLEMNASALLCMLDFFEGNFIDIGKLQSEALWVSCHTVSLGGKSI